MLTQINLLHPGDFVIDHGRVAVVNRCQHGRMWYRFVGHWEDGCCEGKRLNYVIDYSRNVSPICCGGKHDHN